VPFLCSVYYRVGKIAILVYERVKISCKVEEMVAKAKYIKGCHILAEITAQLNPGENVAITGNSGVLAYLEV